MTTTYKFTIRIFPTILCVLLCALFLLLAVPGQAVRADEAQQSILDDFIGTDFDVSEYPEDPADSSLRVVHIAETISNELAVYVYQPSAGKNNILATSINIATERDLSDRNNYTLELLGSAQTILKYKVNGLTVSSEPVRFYDISTVYRAYNEKLDGEQDKQSFKDEIGYTVGQQWNITTDPDGKVSYVFTDTETVKITERTDGVVRYFAGNDGFNYLDRHFVAFSTDRNIDEINSIDVSFNTVRGVGNFVLGIYMVTLADDPPTPVKVHITRDQMFGTNSIITRFDKSWQGIETSAKFLETTSLRDDVRAEVEKTHWVLSFFHSNYKQLTIGSGVIGPMYETTEVTDVTLLQMNFIVDGKVYDLGVVDDKRTGNYYPVNWEYGTTKPDDRFSWKKLWNGIKSVFGSIGDFFKNSFGGHWWAWIVIGIGIIVFLVFSPILIPLLWTAVKVLFKGLWWLISAPFKWIHRKIIGGDGT